VGSLVVQSLQPVLRYAGCALPVTRLGACHIAEALT